MRFQLLMTLSLIGCGAITLASSAEEAAPAFSADDLAFFEKRVRPVLVNRCYECHAASAEKLRGGLLVDSREGVLRGGDSGPAAVAGDVTASAILKGIRYDSEELQMPPAGKLPEEEIAALTEWVRRGLPFPTGASVAPVRRTIDWEAGRKHWAFQPLRPADLPASSDQPARTRIDPFIQSVRAAHKLAAAPEATQAVLSRRLAFDLLGLPWTDDETPDSVTANADAPDFLERTVDRMLASPHYGERWGRHWLDLARYADVLESWREGQGRPWLYRDWVVAALNADMPYDIFVRKQLAVDLLPDFQPADSAALGFLGLSPTYWKELKLDHNVIKQVVAEEWEERIEAIGGTFLGLTVACARCHDHKFDPISTHDYYALAGVLASSKLDERPIIDTPLALAAKQARNQVKEWNEQADKLLKMQPVTDEAKQQAEALRAKAELLRRETPHYDTPWAFAVTEASLLVLPDGEHRTKIDYRDNAAQDVPLQIRGNAAKVGAAVPRRFLTVLSSDPNRLFQIGSGRRELADSIVSDAAPLAARVFVNRVWRQIFGRGLVTTPSNFGIQAEPPSHPELLDDLSARFIAAGWSVKWLQRELLLSATYRQSSQRSPFATETDPDNVWLSRMPVRRCDVEAWRDALLTASNSLDFRVGGEPVDLQAATNHRRTLYGVVKRRELSDVLRLHDFPDPVSHSAAREPTTTPLQQLFTMNSPFLAEQSSAVAQRLLRANGSSNTERIDQAYRQLFGRSASPTESTAISDFLATCQAANVTEQEAWQQLAQTWLASNEFYFID